MPWWEEKTWLLLDGTDDDLEAWRQANQETKKALAVKPFPNGKAFVHWFEKHRPSAWRRLAHNRPGASPARLVREMHWYWSNPFPWASCKPVAAAELLLAGRTTVDEVAMEVGLPLSHVKGLWLGTVKGKSMSQTDRMRGTARWHTLKAIKRVLVEGWMECSQGLDLSLIEQVPWPPAGRRLGDTPKVPCIPLDPTLNEAVKATPIGIYQRETDPEGRRLLAHRMTWIREHGRIPKGCVVHHVDGNPRNNAKGNLAMLPKGLHDLIHSREKRR